MGKIKKSDDPYWGMILQEWWRITSAYKKHDCIQDVASSRSRNCQNPHGKCIIVHRMQEMC
jgi:hypothetical protein